LATISTMNSRHGVNAKAGSGNLEACLSMVVEDEAHQRKSSDTQGNELICWLRVDAVILATASIIPNFLADADGCAVLLDRFGDDPCDDQKLKLLPGNGDRQTNPFLLEDSDAILRLRHSAHGIRSFVTRKSLLSTNAGTERAAGYLAMVWKHFLNRRTYASPDP
jgi:hypothetical protein